MHYKYVIVGGGMTADAALQAIRERDDIASLALLSAEPDPPYDRPPLTKGLWKGKPEEKIWRQTKAHENLSVLLQTRAVSLDAKTHCVTASDGTTYSYDKLLLATGGTPRRLPFGGDNILYYRTLQDYHRLRELTSAKQTFAIIGGGFIGSELAAALTMNDKQVTMFFPQKAIGGGIFPADLAEFLNAYYRKKGVDVQSESKVTNVRLDGEKYILTTQSEKNSGGREFRMDAIIAGIGIEPNLDLAREAGLDVGDGILVDEYLRTNDPNIYAAGDVANVYKPLLDKRMRIEHEDNANAMGRAAGRNMTGAQERFTYQPYFYSDLFDLGYEAVGDLAPEYEIVSDWQAPYRQGVVYYLGNGRVRGVLLWNVWHQRDAARALMAKGPFDAQRVRGQIEMGKRGN